MDKEEREERLEAIFDANFERDGQVPVKLMGYRASRVGIIIHCYANKTVSDSELIIKYYDFNWKPAMLELEKHVDKRLLRQHESVGKLWLDKNSGEVTDIEIDRPKLLNDDVEVDELIDRVEQAGYGTVR